MLFNLTIIYIIGFVITAVIVGGNLADTYPRTKSRQFWARWLLATPVWPVFLLTYTFKGFMFIVDAAGLRPTTKNKKEGYIR